MKKNIVISLATFVFCISTFHFLFTFKHEGMWWNDQEAIYFFPIWSIALAFVAFYFSNKYFQKRILFFPVKRPLGYDIDRAKEQWRWEKRNMLYKGVEIGRKLFGISVPVFVLAYIDESKHLKSNWFLIVFFLIATMLCFYFERKLKKELYE